MTSTSQPHLSYRKTPSWTEPLLQGETGGLKRRATPPSPSRSSRPVATARLSERSQHVARETEQGETLFGTTLKVITCGLGSGILVAPWGAAGASLVVSHAITFLVLLANAWTVMVIVHAVDRWGGPKIWVEASNQWIGSPRRPGYRIDDLGQLLRQSPGILPAVAVFWDVTVNLSNFGVLVGYMIVLGGAMPPLMSSGCSDMTERTPWIILGSLLCLPLCWADLKFLSLSSGVGVAANIYLFVVLLRVLVLEGVAENVCVFGWSPGALACASNLVFAVVLLMVIPEYYTQLRRDDQDPSRFLWNVLVPSFTFIFCLICAFSTVGYLAYGPGVSSNVLLDLPADAWGRSTQIAICIACLMVYPNMLRPMLQPLLRFVEWLAAFPGKGPPDRLSSLEVTHLPEPSIYEGRLVHTELVGRIEVDTSTGDVTLRVADTYGFEKDSLVFVDGERREYGVVKEVLVDSDFCSGSLRLRPRYGAEANQPVMSPSGFPVSALADLTHPRGTKVVLDEDPVLINAAVAGEQCLHMSFTVGITPGARIVIGEGARVEKHKVTRVDCFEPEQASIQAGIRTHDVVLFLAGELAHNHGAHTRITLDHGATETLASVIVCGVMLVSFFVTNLGIMNVVNGAVSVAVMVGIVPAMCAWNLNTYWSSGPKAYAPTIDQSPRKDGSIRSYPSMPLSIRYKYASLVFGLLAAAIGIACCFFTDNHVKDLSEMCTVHLS